MDYNIDNEHFNATFKALVEANALLTLPEHTLMTIVKQQGNGAADGIIKLLFKEAEYLLQPGDSRWMESQKGFEDCPWGQSEEAADRMFSELRTLSKLSGGPQQIFDLLFMEVPDIGEQWVCCVDQESPWYWLGQLDNLIRHMTYQQYKQKATSP